MLWPHRRLLTRAIASPLAAARIRRTVWRASLIGALSSLWRVYGFIQTSSTRGTFPFRYYGQPVTSDHDAASVEPYRKSVPSSHILCRMTASLRATIDETWRGEAEVEEPPVATGLAGAAARPLVASSQCGVFQPQDEPVQKELTVAQPEGARADGDVPLHLLRGATHLNVLGAYVR